MAEPKIKISFDEEELELLNSILKTVEYLPSEDLYAKALKFELKTKVSESLFKLRKNYDRN